MSIKPQFWYCTDAFLKIWNDYGVYFSKKFCSYFSKNIEKILFVEAGLKPSYKVGLSLFRPHHDLPMYEPGQISRINTAISILPMYKGNISFCWRCKSGNIVATFDEEFDESDLECWIEGLNPAEYLAQLTSVSTNHPLKLKNLPYEFVVQGFGTHMGLTIELTEATKAEDIVQDLSNEVEKHNAKSEAKDRAYGVVHNSSATVRESCIHFRIDLGSAGIAFVRKLLRRLAKYPQVKRVVVDL